MHIYTLGIRRELSCVGMRRHETEPMYTPEGSLITGQTSGKLVKPKAAATAGYRLAVSGKGHMTGRATIFADCVVVSMFGYGDKPVDLYYSSGTPIDKIITELGFDRLEAAAPYHHFTV